MENISFKISLESYKSRIPLIFPSLIDGKVNYVLSTSLENRKNGNYGGIPLNLEPKIVGYLSNFTPEMAVKYGNYAKTFTYEEILEIFTFFQRYYSYIYSNESVYEDLQDYADSITNISENERESFVQMEKTFKEYGGVKFYKWLLDYYFGIIDFRFEYTTYYNQPVTLEWLKCVDNLPPVLYYVDAYDFYQDISLMHDKFKDIDNIIKCANVDACCECAKYFSYGGNKLYEILGAWIERINNHLEFLQTVHEDNVSNLSICVNLKRKVEDLGNFSMFSADFIPGNEYNIGNVCTYENDVYILKEGNGYKIDSATETPVFDVDGWERYINVYNQKHQDMGLDFDSLSSDHVVSGRTVSMLEEFLACTTDAMGNILPGRFEPNQESYCPHPAENSIIGLPYIIGTPANIDKEDGDTYFGDLLYAIHFYPCDSTGKRISDVVFSAYANDNPIESINKSIEIAHELEYWDEVIGADFEYYKGAELTYNGGRFEVCEKNGKKVGVKCIDRCKLEIKNTLYYLTSNESYPIRYYNIKYNIETRESDAYGKEVVHKMCEFYLNPKCYEANYRNLIASPLFRKDETLGFSGHEKVIDNIYIDRGYATVLDRHLKVCEVNSLDELVSYGNGSFDIINLETQG